MYRRHLEKLARTRLDDVLLDEGLIERSHIEDAQAEQEMTGNQLSHVLFEREALDEWELAKIVSTHYSLPFIDVSNYAIPRPAVDLLPREFCESYSIVPIDVFGEAMALAVCEMPSPELLKEIIERSKRTPFLYVAVRRAIHDALKDQAKDAAKAAKRRPKAAVKPKPVPVEKPTEATAVAVAEPEPQIELVTPSEPEAPAPPRRVTAPLGELPPITMKLGSSMHGPSAAAPVRTPSAKPVVSRFGGGAKKKPAAKTAKTGKPGEPGDGSWESIFDFGDDAIGK